MKNENDYHYYIKKGARLNENDNHIYN